MSEFSWSKGSIKVTSLGLPDSNCYKRQCDHFLGVRWFVKEGKAKVICEAFRAGVPDFIAYGENLHLTPIEGQRNRIVFERKESS